MVDVEDIGSMLMNMKQVKEDSHQRGMVTPEIRQSLTKQG